jgi:hypothetical protein
MLYLAIATNRALVLDWHKDGIPYVGTVFRVNKVNWTMPQNCAWNSNLFHVIDPPYDGLNDLVKSADAQTQQSDSGRRAKASLLLKKTKMADMFSAADSKAQVVRVSTNLQTPQQSPELWRAALESLPSLKELSRAAILPVGCAYSFLFEPTSALREAYDRIKIQSSSFIGIHLRVGDQDRQKSPEEMLQWQRGVSLLAGCVGSALELLRSDALATSACQKPASQLAFFSDSQAVKDFSRTAGMLVTGVLPLHSEKDRMSVEQRVSTIAELHALADSTTFLTDTRRSGFANLALELGSISQGRRLESFGMRILADVIEICRDRADGQPFQTFGDSTPAALALDTRQKGDRCVTLRKPSDAGSMLAEREQ